LEQSRQLVDSYNKQALVDRLNLLIETRMKKNEEKRKSCQLNPSVFLRPIFRPNNYQSNNQSPGPTGPVRFNRFTTPNSPYNIRRPLNPTMINQMVK
jgi:hypothetical protein